MTALDHCHQTSLHASLTAPIIPLIYAAKLRVYGAVRFYFHIHITSLVYYKYNIWKNYSYRNRNIRSILIGGRRNTNQVYSYKVMGASGKIFWARRQLENNLNYLNRISYHTYFRYINFIPDPVERSSMKNAHLSIFL